MGLWLALQGEISLMNSFPSTSLYNIHLAKSIAILRMVYQMFASRSSRIHDRTINLLLDIRHSSKDEVSM